MMTSSQALERGLADNAEDALRLIGEPSTHVFLSGLGKIAAVFDKVMAEQEGSPEDWKAIKERMIDEGRWSELLYG
jgi:ferredoxin--NADP+ reductase